MNTVLVVDDEPLVVTLVARVLTAAGFRVLSTSDPEEALAICRDVEVDVDILLTDLMMPVMNGQQLRDRVVELRPGIGVVFMSGYADSGARAMLGPDAPHVLLKPFGLPSLLMAMQKGLERRPIGPVRAGQDSAVA
jgi:two-component system, cell cycle sensor histidine kinase and response regulator CckA